MKFIDGNWQMRPGVGGLHPMHVHDVEVQTDSVTLYAPTRLVQHRGATLDQAMFTIRLSAPHPGTVRVEAWRHDGQPVPSPCFGLSLSNVPPLITVDDRAVTFTSDDLTVVIERATWRMAFLHGQRRQIGRASCRERV